MVKKTTKTKPISFQKENRNRKMRLQKTASAKEAIGKIEKNTDTFILTFGQFSLIDAVLAIIDQTGPADVTISTWTAADAHLERSAELVESATFKSFRLIVDASFEARQPGYCHHMRELFGYECIRAIRTHAKFVLIRSAEFDIVVRTSMNLNENPRLENIEISESREFAEYFQAIVDSVFAEVGEDTNRYDILQLEGIPDESPYQKVHAKQIDRDSLNECEVRYTLKQC